LQRRFEAGDGARLKWNMEMRQRCRRPGNCSGWYPDRAHPSLRNENAAPGSPPDAAGLVLPIG